MPIGGTAFFGMNQSPRLTTTYLNQLNRHGDPAPGVPVSTAQMSGSIVQPYGGFEGGKLTITNPWAAQFADPAVGPVYGGIYMYVQVDPKATVPLFRGSLMYWLDELKYIVTVDALNPSTSKPNKIAGIAVNLTLPGYWDFIQIAGIASVFINTAGNIGDVVKMDPLSVPPFQVITSAAGGALDQNSLGTAVLSAPVTNGLSPVELSILQGYNY